MSETTGIQWTEKTWNPIIGCTKIHSRCANCYMYTEMHRYGRNPAVVVRTKTWGDPPKWQRAAEKAGRQELVFTCSWSDWFHADADQWRDEMWAVVKACPNLTFQILTKRPERIADHLPADWGNGYPNVWLGSSLDPDDKNGMALFSVPAKVHFLSLEPLLAPVQFARAFAIMPVRPELEWVIVGGESGHGARACNVEWIRNIISQCKMDGVPCFVKQLGSKAEQREIVFDSERGIDGKLKVWPLQLKHKKGGDMSEWPEDLRVRQFPEPPASPLPPHTPSPGAHSSGESATPSATTAERPTP